jgi:FG-GAP-like repeat/Dockerin type I domain
MFQSRVKSSTKGRRGFFGNLPLQRRGQFRPFLEQLEPRTTPAFVSGVPIGNVSVGQGGAQDVVTGDFNHDGKLDIVATRLDHQFQLYEGNGNGTFQSPISVAYPPGDNAYSVAAADLNGDKNLDVVTCDTNLGYVYVSLGNGDGTFQPMVHYTAAVGARKILITDVDGDGYPDIVISGFSSSKIGVLINQGDGTFTLGTAISTPFGEGDMTLGHFYGNPDRLDLAVDIASDTNEILVYKSNGDGTFQAGQVVETSVFNVGGMTTADVNGDGKDDLIAAVSGVVQVFLGNGNGSFKAPVSYNAHVPGNLGGQIVTADLRHNGKLDLIVANTVTTDISVLLGNGDGTFQPATNYVLNYATDTVVAADFDGDGNLDVIAGDLYGQDIEFLKGNGNGTLQDSIDYVTPGTEGIGFIASGDLNHDGITDLVTTGSRGSSVDVWIGNGDGSYQPPVSYQVGAQPQGLFLADLDKDGNLDITAADAGDSNANHAIAVLLGNGDGTFKPVEYVAGYQGIYDVTVVDLNGDGKMDLAAVSPHDNALSIYFGNGDGTFKNPVNYSTDLNPNYVVAANFNGDSHPDLLVTAHGGDGGDIDVELNKGNGQLQIPPSAILYDYSPSNAVASDLRNNGINDILYADANNSFGYFLGNGNGTFQSGQSMRVFDGPVFVAVGDFDGDSIPDVAVCGNSSNDITILKGDGAGNFAAESLYRNAGPTPGAMVAADLDNDGTLDLAVADNGSNYITILRNQSSTGVYFLVTAQSTPDNGDPTQYVVTAVNVAGQTVNNYSGTVHFTSNDPAAILPADMTLTNGVGTVSATFKTSGNQYLRATDSANHDITGTSADFSIGLPGPVPDHFGFTGAPSSPVAGASFNVTVTAYDSSNHILTGYRGVVHFTSTDTGAILPADYTFTVADAGIRTLGVTLTTAGAQAVTVGVVGNAKLNATQSGITVKAGTLSKLALTALSSGSQTAGLGFFATLTATDAYGNTVAGYTGTVHFSSSDTQAVLPSDYTFVAANNGTRVFSIILQTAGSESITASDVSNSSLTSTLNESVAPSFPASLLMTSSPDTAAGAVHSFSVTVVDPYGNTTANYAGTVSFSSSDTQADLPANYTFGAGDAGVHTFNVTMNTAGSQTISAIDTTNKSIAGVSNAITVFAPIAVQGAQVNDGSAQRSMVQSLTVSFDHAVTLDPGAFSIVLHANATIDGVGGQSEGTLPNLSWTTSDGGLTYVVTFSGAGVLNHSIADGIYDLHLNSAMVHDVVGQTLATDYVFAFFRLFGDFNGDGTVNNSDSFQFSRDFNKSVGQTGYLAFFDFNGDGTINNSDSFQFNKRFNTTFKF